ncbi:hypothetical protein F4779DRAFT_206009 [Xylariaceae sp. FL0662B]|nr:hypothetical protein F4779DRAFT_206009 [Xylariaceae sp. FL0662B]
MGGKGKKIHLFVCCFACMSGVRNEITGCFVTGYGSPAPGCVQIYTFPPSSFLLSAVCLSRLYNISQGRGFFGGEALLSGLSRCFGVFSPCLFFWLLTFRPALLDTRLRIIRLQTGFSIVHFGYLKYPSSYIILGEGRQKKERFCPRTACCRNG